MADLGIYMLPGRVSDPRRGITEAVEAEQHGFCRIWLAERYDVKEAGVVLGAAGASTRSIGLATGLIADGARLPLMTAALAATMQGAFGDRFTLGLGRGIPAAMRRMQMRASSIDEFTEYVATVRGLLHGETVGELALIDRPDAPPPPIVFGTFGGPRGLDIAARYCDGILLPGYLTPDAVRTIKAELAERCDVHGRTVKLFHTMVCAPELGPAEVREIVHARAVQYFQMPGSGGWKGYMNRNGWDEAPFRRLHAHPQLSGSAAPADQAFTRADLASPAALIPDEWMQETTAYGSLDDCIATFQRFADAGVDEFVIHGASPAQAARLPGAWRAAQHHEVGRA